MITARSGMFAPTIAAIALLAGVASAEDFAGKVKSVDAEGQKVVIVESATDKERVLTVDSSTAWTKEKKGKVAKKFDLTKLKVGSEVEVTSQGTLASRVIIKAGKKKKAKDA